jgi:hypothetical protein
MDLINIFTKFGNITHISSEGSHAYIAFQQPTSLYLAIKTLNEFQVNEKTRLRLRICTEQEALHAGSAFTELLLAPPPLSGQPQLKHIAKFEFCVESLPGFVIPQHLIGPKGSYMKKIIERMLARHPLAHTYTLANIDSVFKMRVRGRGSGFL